MHGRDEIKRGGVVCKITCVAAQWFVVAEMLVIDRQAPHGISFVGAPSAEKSGPPKLRRRDCSDQQPSQHICPIHVPIQGRLPRPPRLLTCPPSTVDHLVYPF